MRPSSSRASGAWRVTIGPLAERLGLSKSGLFAHFRSKEALQVETLDRAAELFGGRRPARCAPSRTRVSACGCSSTLARLARRSGLSGGCPILAAAIKYDDVPGPVHEAAAAPFRLTCTTRCAAPFARAARPDGDAEMIAGRGQRACDVASGAAAPARRRAGARRDDARAFDALLAALISWSKTMPQTITTGYKTLLEAARREVEGLSVDEARALHGRSDVMLVDIRDIRELQRDGKVPGAFHCPRGMLEFWIDPQSPYYKDALRRQDKKYVFFCAGGIRSALAAQTAQKDGAEAGRPLSAGGFGGGGRRAGRWRTAAAEAKSGAYSRA